ncbi:hypothetical protein [Acinetobacter sp. CIP 102129]|uniref:hypothetical protein n=1 Tax=Acinetobacter sp. CIP 102129 TaxID=1144664 RepID=UPI0002CDBE77|nr:hypothetical protein [Acinetobacter sp. CIP 102129]ENU86122.1 hypothetical protein F973_01719 [Acinetobacter sp. CIP 102129]
MDHKLQQAIASDLGRENYDYTANGIYLPRQGILVSGEYFDRINGGEWQHTCNLVVNEGLAHLLNVAMGSKAKSSGYYLALFSGATAPAANWTAANFAAVSSEIVSMTEGYTNATRPQWTPTDTTSNQIDNFTATASVTIATSSQLNVTGAALLTNSTKGGTSGTLISATKYSAARTFQDGDVYDIGYRLSFTAA